MLKRIELEAKNETEALERASETLRIQPEN